jgi:predicted RNA-binding protein YlxR (DUF448 family)
MKLIDGKLSFDFLPLMQGRSSYVHQSCVDGLYKITPKMLGKIFKIPKNCHFDGKC